jgi:hypothetical protein
MIVSTMALPEDLHRRLAIAAVEDRIAMTELVRRALADWLDRRDKGRARKGAR